MNERQRKRVVAKLQRELHTLKGKRVALLGLAFKPNTDAMKHSPNIKGTFDPYEALEGAHAAVVTTEWEEFRELDLARATSLMKEPSLLVDGRNVLNPSDVKEAGLSYRGFGRG